MTFLDVLLRKENNASNNSTTQTLLRQCPLYALSVREDMTLIGTFLKYSNDNYIELIETGRKFHHRLPPSKVSWHPNSMDTFASTSTSLRIWRTSDEKPAQKLYPTGKSGNLTPCPMTSLSWNPFTTSRVVTSSIDTTLSVWDVEVGKMETQLIAHDKSVLDVCYGMSAHQFASVSEDGSLRLFDSRDLDHSTIIYEDSVPLLRVSWQENGSCNSNLLATIAADSPDVMLFDVRKPGFLTSVVRLGPKFPNALAWSRTGSIAAGMSDGSVVICQKIQDTISQQEPNISKIKPGVTLPPVAGYTGGGVSNIAWIGDRLTIIHGSSISTSVVN